jgi:hypothetical protein
MPTQRGTATTDASDTGGFPITAPTGLATGDTVFICIVTEDADDPNWSLAGFTSIFEEQRGGDAYWMTILRGTVAGAPPANFTPTTGATLDYWHATCLAYYDASPTNEVVGTSYNSNPFSTSPFNIPGITVTDDGSEVLAFTAERFGTVVISGWTTINSASSDIYADPFDAGATGTVSGTPSNGFQPIIAVLVSVPPAPPAGALPAPLWSYRSSILRR